MIIVVGFAEDKLQPKRTCTEKIDNVPSVFTDLTFVCQVIAATSMRQRCILSKLQRHYQSWPYRQDIKKS